MLLFCRTQCPVGHEPVDLTDSVDCPAVEDVLSENDSSSLWLIKLPHDVSYAWHSFKHATLFLIVNNKRDIKQMGEK